MAEATAADTAPPGARRRGGARGAGRARARAVELQRELRAALAEVRPDAPPPH